MKEFIIEMSPIIASISTLIIAIYAILNYHLIKAINKANNKMLKAVVISNVLGSVAQGVGSFSGAINTFSKYFGDDSEEIFK